MEAGVRTGDSDRSQAVEHALQQGQVRAVAALGRPVDHHHALVGHVTDQHAGDAEGRSSLAEISATERMSRHRAAIARCSTVSFGDRSPREVVETSASISRSVWAGRVRPPVMA